MNLADIRQVVAASGLAALTLAGKRLDLEFALYCYATSEQTYKVGTQK